MPDSTAELWLEIVRAGSVSTPLYQLLRNVSTTVRDIGWDRVETVRANIVTWLQNILLDSGCSEASVDETIDWLEHSLADIMPLSIAQIQNSIREAYEWCINWVHSPAKKPILVVGKKLRSDADIRISLRILRDSDAFEELKNDKIWTLSSAKLRERLESSPCSIEKCHWYMILSRIVRYKMPENMVWTGMIAADTLRNFLCDYVFCVPRESFIHKPHGRKPNGDRQGSYPDNSPPPALNGQPLKRKRDLRTEWTPPITHINTLTPAQRELVEFYYKYNGSGFHPTDRWDLEAFRQKKRVKRQAIYFLLSQAREKLFSEETPVQRKRWRPRKWSIPSLPVPSVLFSVPVQPREIVSRKTSRTPRKAPRVLKPVQEWPKWKPESQITSPGSSAKFSLRGVIIPADLPDPKNIAALSQIEREMFRLHYGHDWIGDDSSPDSYQVPLRLSRPEIATKQGRRVEWVYQNLQRAILKLWFPGKSRENIATPLPPVPADPVRPLSIYSTAPAPVRPTRTIAPPVRPICEQIPEDKTETYADLLIWLWHSEQADIFLSFHGVLQRCRKNIWYHTPPLDTQIFGSYTRGSIGSQILLLVRYFDPNKTFEKFIEETWPNPLAPKPKPLRPACFHTVAPVFQSIPLPPPEWPPVVPVVEPDPPSIKPAPVVLFGLNIPEFSDYAEFIAWASEQEKIVTPLQTFYLREAQRGNKRPGTSRIFQEFWEKTHERSILMIGCRLITANKSPSKVLLDICRIPEEIFPARVTETPEPDPEREITPDSEDLDIDTAYLRLLDTIQKNQKWMPTIRETCATHTSGNYHEFVSILKRLRTTDLWGALGELCDLENKIGIRDKGDDFEEKSTTQMLFQLIGLSFTEEDRGLYLFYPDWKERIGDILSENGYTDLEIARIINLPNSEIDGALKKIALKVPLGKKEWPGYEEKSASVTNLYEVMIRLIRNDKSGQKWYNGTVEHKELRAKLKHIKFPKEETE